MAIWITFLIFAFTGFYVIISLRPKFNSMTKIDQRLNTLDQTFEMHSKMNVIHLDSREVGETLRAHAAERLGLTVDKITKMFIIPGENGEVLQIEAHYAEPPRVEVNAPYRSRVE